MAETLFSVQAFKDKFPKFFSRSNRAFFGDRRYKCYRGHLIVFTHHAAWDVHPAIQTIPIYAQTEDGTDLHCVGHAEDLRDAKRQIDSLRDAEDKRLGYK